MKQKLRAVQGATGRAIKKDKGKNWYQKLDQ